MKNQECILYKPFWGRLPTVVFFLSICCLMASCSKEQELGLDFFAEESFDVSLIDTLSLDVSSVLPDTLATDQSGRILVGYHQDPLLGGVKVSPFFQLGLSSSSTISLEEEEVIYDSICLVLRYDGYTFYDTSQALSFTVHEVMEEIAYEEEGYALYSSSSFLYEDIPLGAYNKVIRSDGGEEISVRLGDDFGQFLLGLALDDEDGELDDEKLKDYLHGLTIIPNLSTSGPIVGFGLDSELRIYYKDKSVFPSEESTISFELGSDEGSINTTLYFNQFSFEREGTVFSKLSPSAKSLSAAHSGNMAFIQGGEGISLRVEMPYIRSLLYSGGDFLVTGATLEFYPLSTKEDENMPAPSTLKVYWVDEDNGLLQTNTDAILMEDYEFGRETHYEVDVTDFLSSQLYNEELNQNALLFQLPEAFNASATRLLVGNGESDTPMRLNLYLLSI